MAKIFFLLFIALVVHLNIINAQRCGPNATWSTCASRCPVDCERLRNPDPIICTADCVRGCKCNRGYIRISRRNTNCMRERDCPHFRPNTV